MFVCLNKRFVYPLGCELDLSWAAYFICMFLGRIIHRFYSSNYVWFANCNQVIYIIGSQIIFFLSKKKHILSTCRLRSFYVLCIKAQFKVFLSKCMSWVHDWIILNEQHENRDHHWIKPDNKSKWTYPSVDKNYLALQ